MILLFHTLAYAQTQPVNQTDAAGKKQGLWKKYNGPVLIIHRHL